MRIRNRISFAYLVQAEGWFNTSAYVHDGSVALVAGWKHNHTSHITRLGVTYDASFHFPNSSLNEGRNELLQRLLMRYPFTVFEYYIYVDEDLIVAVDPQISSACDSTGSSNTDAASRSYSTLACSLRYFERILLEYRPALAVPRNSIQHDQDPEWTAPVVQLLPHFMVDFDHILVAIRAEVASMFLPMETRFDSNCWWHAQAVWSVVAQAFYREQTMQFNAIYTRSGYSRPSDELRMQQASQQEQQKQNTHIQLQKKYLRCSSLSPAALWIIHSLQAHLQLSIMFRQNSVQLYGAYDGGNVHTVQPVAQPQTQAYDINPQFVARIADCCHPYWHSHGLFWHFAGGRHAQPAACKDVMTFERYHTSSSGEIVNSCFHLPFEGATAEDAYRMARGSYWQLHNFFHPEVLQLKRQQQLLQQQLQHALEELRGSISTVELLNARVTELEEAVAGRDIIHTEQ